MRTVTAFRHAAGHYRRTFARLGDPVRRVEAEERHLHQIERRGESAETPFIAMLGLLLFLLGPLLLVLLGLALTAYYLTA
jgi:hypothetical protein